MKKEKVIFFDTGPIISLVMTRLVWILPKLKEKFGGKFYITPGVKRELIERPMQVRRFEFEAIQVLKLIKEGVLEVYEKIPKKKIDELEKLANNSFQIKGRTLEIIQTGEIEAVACALDIGAEAVIMDERTLRLFIENNKEMKKLLEIRFKRPVSTDWEKAKEFSQKLKSIKIIRSIELVGVAYKMGILDDYIPKIKQGREILLESVLWGTKYNGCAVTEHEIEEIEQALLR